MLENVVRWLVYLVLALLALSVPYALFLRPWLRRWDATDEEVDRRLPGDDLVPKPDWVSNRAITIAVPPARVWPWIAQMGYHRDGLYSYDFLHRLLRVAGSVDGPRRSAQHVVAVAVWWQGWWTLIGRLHYTVITLVAAALVLWQAYLRILA